MKKLLIIFFVSLSLINNAQNIEDIYKSAVQERENGNFEKSINLLNQGLKLDSLNYLFNIEKYKCYIWMYEYNLAIIEINKAIQINPFNPEAYFLRSLVDNNLGKFDESLNDINKAIQESEKQNIQFADFYSWRGSLYITIRNLKKAEKDFLIALKIDPTNEIILTSYSCLLMEMNKFPESKILLDSLYKKNPNHNRILTNLAFVNIELQNYDEAIDLCDKGIKINSNDTIILSTLYNNKGYAYYFLNRYEDALNQINKAIELNKQNSYAFKNRALILIKLNEKEKACTDLNQAIKLGYENQYGKDIFEIKKMNCK